MKELVLLFVSIFISLYMVAQKYDNPRNGFKHTQEIAQKADIKINKPTGFNEVTLVPSQFVVDPVNAAKSKYVTPGGMVYTAALQSDDKNAMLLYPAIFEGAQKGDEWIEEEVTQFFGNDDMDISKYIQVNDGGQKFANADKAAVYKFTTSKPFYGQYNYFINVYLRKKNHPFMLLKVALTKDGLKNADKYVNSLLSSIAYGNGSSAFAQANGDDLSSNELKFPLQKRTKRPGGIIDTNPLQKSKLAEEGKYDPISDM